MVRITTATAVVACVLGFLTLFFTRVGVSSGRVNVVQSPSAFRTLEGAVLGGALSGIICAPVLTLYFGAQSGPKALPGLLVPSGIVGASIFVFSIINFDFERLSSRRLLVGFSSALTAILFGGIAAAALFGLLSGFGVVDMVVTWLTKNSKSALIMLAGGAIYGTPVGVALGLVIGMAITLQGRWENRPFFALPTE